MEFSREELQELLGCFMGESLRRYGEVEVLKGIGGKLLRLIRCEGLRPLDELDELRLSLELEDE